MRMTSVVLAGLLLLGSAVAQAQVKPKILILFDTSGSMMQNSSNVWQNGDGSQLCTGLGQQSRIFQLKTALFEALQGMGANEVDFGLATFPMLVDPTRKPYCALNNSTCTGNADCRPGETCSSQLYYIAPCGPGNSCPSGQTCVPSIGYCVGKICESPCQSSPSCSGHYYTSNATLSEIPALSACTNSGIEDCRYGCKVSTHSPASQTSASCGDPSNPCSAWYTQMEQEVLKVKFGSPPEDVMEHFDQLEDTDTIAPLVNPEVRAGNGWYTPLGKSLFYAHGYFHKEVAPAIPAYEKPCTNLVVAFFSDGNETCNQAQSDPFYPTKWAANLNTNLGVVTHTVGIDLDSGASALLGQIASSGKGTYYNVAGNTAALKQAFLDIVAKALPPVETCNGLDDDCDNKVDEDFPLKGQSCDNGKIGLCYQTGVYACKTDGTGVVCNAPNVNGTPEICNGIDDDCDGIVDNVTKTCTQNSDCASLGKASCVGGSCSCTVCLPQPEVCNGKDDDCDGQVDEGFVSTPCGKNIGECTPGQTKCVAGKIICDGGTAGTAEVCNNKDDDCDGIIDGMSDSCYPPGLAGCTQDSTTKKWTCVGFCQPGMMTCTAGVWGNCTGYVGPDKETCNGQDDDCDGLVDEDDDCPTGTKCVNGQCVSACGTGEFVCPVGQLCKDGYCVPDPCYTSSCLADGGVCKNGVCIKPCDNVTCTGKYEQCIQGACVDVSCYNPQYGCKSGEVCVQGKCVPDPCASASCPGDEMCVNGACVPVCDPLACAEDEVCKVVDQGGKKVPKCVKDPCASQQCGPGYVCKDGTCIVDPCNTTTCETGEVCVEGKCIPNPCEGVVCPSGFSCQLGNCVNSSVLGTRELLATGAGGLACNVAVGAEGTPPSGLLLIFAVALLIMIRQSRRD